MSQDVYLDGSLVATTRVRLRANGDQGVAIANAADGSSAEAGIVFDDPDSTMSVPAWRPCYAVETLCTAAPRLFTGYVTGRTYRRGHYRTGSGREIDSTIFDSNVLLQMHKINGADSLRPEETGVARLAWLLGSGYIPLVSDLGLVNGSTLTYDATQYKGQFPSDVLNDLCGPRDQIFFVYWDQAAAGLGLFVDAPTATTYTSTLSVSNVLSDVNDTTCFAPYLDDESTLDPSEVYSNLRYVYAGGVYYAHNLTTAGTFFPLPIGHRDTEVENMKVGKLTTAITFATRILARDALENQIITMTVKLPASKVGLIDAGMRLNVRLSHVPGFTSFTYTRVEQITKAQTEGTPDFYDVGLRLSTHGIVGGGGTGSGSTLPFPISSGTPPTSLGFADNSGAAGPGHSAALPSAPADGDLLVLFRASRTAVAPLGDISGWTRQANTESYEDVGFGVGIRYAALYTKAASSDGASPYTPLAGELVTIENWGDALFGGTAINTDQNTAALGCGSISPTGPSVVVGCATIGNFDALSYSVTPAAGVTETSDYQIAGVMPFLWSGRVTFSAVVTTTITGTINGGAPGRFPYGALSYYVLRAAGSDPPLPGQPVINEFVANGDGTTVTFTTANPYAPLSLHVRVDGVAIVLGLVETDPATGTFTLDFAPLGAIGDSPAEKVYVDYVVAA